MRRFHILAAITPDIPKRQIVSDHEEYIGRLTLRRQGPLRLETGGNEKEKAMERTSIHTGVKLIEYRMKEQSRRSLLAGVSLIIG